MAKKEKIIAAETITDQLIDDEITAFLRDQNVSVDPLKMYGVLERFRTVAADAGFSFDIEEVDEDPDVRADDYTAVFDEYRDYILNVMRGDTVIIDDNSEFISEDASVVVDRMVNSAGEYGANPGLSAYT